MFCIYENRFAFEKYNNNFHYELCTIDNHVYRNDEIERMQLREQYCIGSFIVLPGIDVEAIMQMFINQLNTDLKQLFQVYMKSNNDEFREAFHCFTEDFDDDDKWSEYEESVLCEFAIKWCEEQGLPYA